jgi:hypothetical protein
LLGSLSTMTGCDMDKSYFARLEMQNDRVGIKRQRIGHTPGISLAQQAA